MSATAALCVSISLTPLLSINTQVNIDSHKQSKTCQQFILTMAIEFGWEPDFSQKASTQGTHLPLQRGWLLPPGIE